MTNRIKVMIYAAVFVIVFLIAGCIPYYGWKNDMTALFDRDRYVTYSESLIWQYSLRFEMACHCYPPHYTMREKYTLFKSIVLLERDVDMMMNDDGTELVPYDPDKFDIPGVVTEIESVI